MRSFNNFWRATIAVLLVLGLSGFACAASISHSTAGLLFSDDFEGVAVGSPPDSGIWRYIAPYVDVIDDPLPGPTEGSQYAKFNRPDKNHRAEALGNFASQDSGILHFESMVYIPSQTTQKGPALAFALGEDTDGGSAIAGARIYVAANDSTTITGPNVVGTYDDLLQVYVDTTLRVTPDAWQKWEIDFTFDSVNGDSYIITIDDVSAGPFTHFYLATGPIDALSFSGGSNVSTFYVDAIPEPSTLVIVGGGLAALLVCGLRRRIV